MITPDAVFSIDYLRLTIWKSMEGVKPLLELFGVDAGLTHSGHGGIGFSDLYMGLQGFQLYANPSNGGEYVSLVLPSKALQFVGMDKLQAGHAWLCEKGISEGLRFRATRVDFAFDTQKFGVGQVVEALEADAVETAAKQVNRIHSLRGDVGDTLYIGSRKSMAMLRVYHKTNGASFGEQPFTRVELELHDTRAELAFLEVMAANMQEWSEMAAALLNGFIRINRDWWREFVGLIGSSWVKLRRKVPTVQSIKEWLLNQVSASLAVYLGAVSGGDLDVVQHEVKALMDAGREKFKRRHQVLIEQYSPIDRQSFAVFSV